MFGPAASADPHKVAAYIRWSTDEQGQGTTLAVQRERVGLFIRSQGWELREDLIFIDDGYSGGSLDRPAMNRLRERVRTGDVACVVVYKLDRLSRNLLDTVTLVRKEWKDRCTLVSATEHFDTHSPVGQMIFNILVSFAEFERGMIRERTLSGKHKRAQQGLNAGQRYPFGYRKAEGGGWALDGWDSEKRCLKGPAATVRRMFDSFLRGMSLSEIAQSLNRDLVPTPEGSEWRQSYVGRILGNPIYAGRYSYGKGRQAPEHRFVVDGAVPSIITEEEFGEVQRLRLERSKQRSKAERGEYLLSGLMTCRACGRPIAGSRGRTKRYYVCTGRLLGRECGCGYMDADVVEGALVSEVRAVIEGLVKDQPEERLRADLERLVAEREYAVEFACGEVAHAERRKRHLEEAFLNGEVDGRAYSELLAKVEREWQGAVGRLGRAERALIVARESAGADLTASVAQVDPWAELTFAERKRLLQELVGSARVFRAKGNPGGRLVFEWEPASGPGAVALAIVGEGLRRGLLKLTGGQWESG